MAIQVSFVKSKLKELFELQGEQILVSVGYDEKGEPQIFAQSFQPEKKRRRKGKEVEEGGSEEKEGLIAAYVSEEQVQGCPYPPGCHPKR